jgi:hypothetical protein
VLYGWIRDGGGDAVVGATVAASAIVPADLWGFQLAEAEVSTVTNASGYFELELVRGILARVVCDAAGLDITILIPDSDSLDLTTVS